MVGNGGGGSENGEIANQVMKGWENGQMIDAETPNELNENPDHGTDNIFAP